MLPNLLLATKLVLVAPPQAVLKTELSEVKITYSHGQRLIFASDGRGGAGNYDLFVAERQGDGRGEAKNLGAVVSSPLDDFDATFLADGRSIVFASERWVKDDARNRKRPQRAAGGVSKLIL